LDLSRPIHYAWSLADMNRLPNNKRAIPAVLIAAVLSCSLAGHAQSKDVLFEAKAEETIRVKIVGGGDEDSRTAIEHQKVQFHHITLWATTPDGANQAIVAKETIRELHDHAREGVESNLKVDFFHAKDSMAKFPTKPTQTLQVPGADEAEFTDEYWIATTHGCCDAEPYSRMYAYGADRPFLRYNEDFWKVEVPNSRGMERYVGLALRGHVANEAAEEAIFGKEKNAIAAVSLAAPGKHLHTVYIAPKEGQNADELGLHTENLLLRGTGDKDEQHPEVQLLTLWAMDGAEEKNARTKAVSGVIVEAGLFLDDGTTETLQVEIRDDKLVNPKIKGTKLRALLP